jgi:hypothetical protein
VRLFGRLRGVDLVRPRVAIQQIRTTDVAGSRGRPSVHFRAPVMVRARRCTQRFAVHFR